MILPATLYTQRLILRPFEMEDIPAVHKLAGDKAIADKTLLIPHPYKEEDAQAWISTHPEKRKKDEAVDFAIVHRKQNNLIGAIGLTLHPEHYRGTLGYWIGKPYWGNGYCTEAAKGIIDYGFTVLGLNRIGSEHYERNPASGRVMQKIGMKYEGCLKQHLFKWGNFENAVLYGILKSDFMNDISSG